MDSDLSLYSVQTTPILQEHLNSTKNIYKTKLEKELSAPTKVGCESRSCPPAGVTKYMANGLLLENKSQIQRVCKNNTPSKAFTCRFKFLLQVNFSNCISSSTQLERGKMITTLITHNTAV